MELRYRVVYTGDLVPGADAENVITGLGERCGLSDSKARALIRGSRRGLKHDLTLERARRYRATLERIGLAIEIVPEGPGPRESSFLSLDTTADHGTDPDMAPPPRRRGAPEAGSTPCPKCGTVAVSPVTGVCDACGVVAERYLARRADELGSADAGSVEQTGAEMDVRVAGPPADAPSVRDRRRVGLAWILTGLLVILPLLAVVLYQGYRAAVGR
jgi:hypothetical protein